MNLIDNEKYRLMLQKIIQAFSHWDKLNGKNVFISGATGLIGGVLIDVLMQRNLALPADQHTRVIGICRNKVNADTRFAAWMNTGNVTLISHDISKPINALPSMPDYFIHAASTTHPVAYATEPVNTVLANIFGTDNILKLATQNSHSRVLLLSTVEIYGENKGDVEAFDENYCGYINCNTLRAGYPEAKRASEALCQAYISQYRADAVIIRLSRCYGPSVRQDSKALSQFITNSIKGEDIVLKSEGTQFFSYAHVADAVLGILWVLLFGECGQAYNLGDSQSDITLRDLAKTIANHVGVNVVFELPNAIESKGFSTATKALLDASKLKALGWKPIYDIKAGVCETIDIQREVLKTSR